MRRDPGGAGARAGGGGGARAAARRRRDGAGAVRARARTRAHARRSRERGRGRARGGAGAGAHEPWHRGERGVAQARGEVEPRARAASRPRTGPAVITAFTSAGVPDTHAAGGGPTRSRPCSRRGRRRARDPLGARGHATTLLAEEGMLATQKEQLVLEDLWVETPRTRASLGTRARPSSRSPRCSGACCASSRPRAPRRHEPAEVTKDTCAGRAHGARVEGRGLRLQWLDAAAHARPPHRSEVLLQEHDCEGLLEAHERLLDRECLTQLVLEGLRKPADGADGDARADGAGLPPGARASAAGSPVVWQHGNVAHVERAFRRRRVLTCAARPRRSASRRRRPRAARAAATPATRTRGARARGRLVPDRFAFSQRHVGRTPGGACTSGARRRAATAAGSTSPCCACRGGVG